MGVGWGPEEPQACGGSRPADCRLRPLAEPSAAVRLGCTVISAGHVAGPKGALRASVWLGKSNLSLERGPHAQPGRIPLRE